MSITKFKDTTNKHQKWPKLANRFASPVQYHDHGYNSSSSDGDHVLSSASSSPQSESSSPFNKSPWTFTNQPTCSSRTTDEDEDSIRGSKIKYGLVGSLFREEGHIHSLATSGNFLYAGSESKNIRVWKGFHDYSGFNANSGFVKAIVILDDKIFTGHQDGKIRVWRLYSDNNYARVGNLPTTKDLLKKSVNPGNYIKVRRKRNVPWVKHYDSVSCMTVDENQGLLYSGSWDKTLKVWRVSDFKCLESVHAHEDAVNSVAAGFDGFVFTGSADGSVKAWRRELVGRHTNLVLIETLLNQDQAVTSLVVNQAACAAYAGTSDGLVSFWEREERFMTYAGVLRGHKMAVLCLATGGDLVMSGSADESICVWRRGLGGVHSCLTVLIGHTGPVKCLTMEKDVAEDKENERWIVYSGSLDKSVKVWRV